MDETDAPEVTFPAVESRTVEEKGISLPWQRRERYGSEMVYPKGHAREGETIYPERQPTGTVIESGWVFIPMKTLYELSEQELWNSQFGSAFLLGYHEGLALEAAGLADQETKGGYHRTDALLAFLKTVEEAEQS